MSNKEKILKFLDVHIDEWFRVYEISKNLDIHPSVVSIICKKMVRSKQIQKRYSFKTKDIENIPIFEYSSLKSH